MKNKVEIVLTFLLVLCLTCCATTGVPKETPQTFANPGDVYAYMLEQNAAYRNVGANAGDISAEKRADTAANGQRPYAVVITCSDSRVPPEHIFNSGIGELFVIRTAGNVIGDYELGSVEYGVEHLGAKLVVVMGHTYCGAVDAAVHGGAHGYIETIVNEISSCLPEQCEIREAERLNVENSVQRILSSEVVQELAETDALAVVPLIYDIETGEVKPLD